MTTRTRSAATDLVPVHCAVESAGTGRPAGTEESYQRIVERTRARISNAPQGPPPRDPRIENADVDRIHQQRQQVVEKAANTTAGAAAALAAIGGMTTYMTSSGIESLPAAALLTVAMALLGALAGLLVGGSAAEGLQAIRARRAARSAGVRYDDMWLGQLPRTAEVFAAVPAVRDAWTALQFGNAPDDVRAVVAHTKVRVGDIITDLEQLHAADLGDSVRYDALVDELIDIAAGLTGLAALNAERDHLVHQVDLRTAVESGPDLDVAAAILAGENAHLRDVLR